VLSPTCTLQNFEVCIRTMTPTHCAIPGCIWSYQYAKTKDVACKTIFTVRRPDLAKSDDERKHREQLTNFLLSVRNSNKGDIIKKMLHKESYVFHLKALLLFV